MSNPINQFENLTGEQLLEEWGGYLQGKVDKRGGTVPAEGSNQRLAAAWVNLVDDLVIAVANGSIGGGSPVPTSEIITNTGSPQATGSAASGGFVDFDVDIPTTRNMLEMLWWSLVRPAEDNFVEDARLQVFSRAARTDQQLIFTAELPQFIVGPTNFILDSSSNTGHKLMLDAFANPLEEPVPGTRRLYLRYRDSGTPEGITLESMLFSYVVRAFDAAIPTLAEQSIPPS